MGIVIGLKGIHSRVLRVWLVNAKDLFGNSSRFLFKSFDHSPSLQLRT